MNNKKTAGRIQLLFTLGIILLSCLLICSITIEALEISVIQWGSGILAILLLIFFIAGGYYYIELSAEKEFIEIKFYNIFPFAREFKMYRIPVSSFIKYEIKGSRFYKQKLIMYQMSSSQLAKYPPVYIAAFSNNDLRNLESFFAKLKS